MKKILIINNKTSYLNEIKKTIGTTNYKIINFKEIRLVEADKFSHIILTGGNKKIDHKIFKEEVKIIKKSKKPILGICFGHQLICSIFGGKTYKLAKKRRGKLKISIVLKDEIFKKMPKNIIVYEDHTHVSKGFNKNLTLLATSEDGVEIIKHKNKRIYGFQFHPEIEFPHTKRLIKNFLKISH